MIYDPTKSGEYSPRLVEFSFQSASHDNISYSVAAGYTAIDKDQFPILTASNGFEGVG